ncbi:MAG: YgiQ family radical SAM protein [Ruminococcaceae bacterium]|nr:YgiQ family radical SAM protein [Oscillospiraceae bacterium]
MNNENTNDFKYNCRKGDKFLPVTAEEVHALGCDVPDFVYVCGDAYVDHPSFGAAIISRVLESEGFTVAILPQPKFTDCEDFKRFGRPRLGFLVSAGNIDSMVAHFTVEKKRRGYDYYSPGGKTKLRPDRAVIVYCNRIREAYGDVPVLIGGIEASLRRFSHYDYWSDSVRRSVLLDSRADILMYGMGEKTVVHLAKLLDKGVPVGKIHSEPQTVFAVREDSFEIKEDDVFLGNYEEIKTDKKAYAESFRLQYRNVCSRTGKRLIEKYANRLLVQNPPLPPLTREELDKVYSLPYTREYHPMYEKDGGIPALTEVKFSVTHNRGCFGGCAFCALSFHQGREVSSRSVESVISEIKLLTTLPDFKGYIHDIGGPTANFRYPSCEKQKTHGVCKNRRCLTPTPCKNLKFDHSEYIDLLKKAENVPGVKKVFIRSGIRFDYIMYDKKTGEKFFRKLVKDHVSGQLKVAPEHCSDNVLALMGKPPISVFESFKEKYFKLCASYGLDQYLVPYVMSSHPGSTLESAAELRDYIKTWGYSPEQMQDFYPTPSTASTCMFYTGLDPFTMKKVYVAKTPEEKAQQRKMMELPRSVHPSARSGKKGKTVQKSFSKPKARPDTKKK